MLQSASLRILLAGGLQVISCHRHILSWMYMSANVRSSFSSAARSLLVGAQSCNCSHVAAKAGSLEKKWSADENQRSALQLEEVEERLRASSDAVWSSNAALAAKVEQTASLAEDAVMLFAKLALQYFSGFRLDR